ncbi:MAG: hypothetical protein EXS14_10590 [Planctomycetes bacterium]|nr:hypothetical protein [Planctomycetota bacterium]
MSVIEIQDSAGLIGAAAVAAGVGVMHTLLGPDHWLPFVALGRQPNYGLRRLVPVVLLCGLLHCLASVAIAALGTVAGASLTAFLQLTEARGVLAGLALLSLGVAMFAPTRADAALAAPRGGRLVWWLLVVFVLGPCEWLIPAAMAAAARYGPQGLWVVSLSFSLATIATMLIATLCAVGVARPFLTRVGPQRARICAASLVVLCALLMLAGF